MSALARAGATVAANGPDTVTVSGLPSERIVEVLGQSGVAFSEVAMHRSTLEEAYMELTRNAVDFRAAQPEVGTPAEAAR
jgi:ABC-2 type transport system ATP-binding protein